VQVRGSLREGFAYAWNTCLIRYAIVMAAASGILFNTGVALPLVATRTFHLGAGGYGAMMAAFGVGAVGGAMIAGAGASYPSARRVRNLALATGAVVLLTATMPDVPAELVALFVTGTVAIWFISLANTLVQLRSSPEVRGRVMGLWVMALPGLGVVTGPLTGWVAESIGPRYAFGLGGVALVCSAAAGWRAFADRDVYAGSKAPT
jgi:MFS family permease